MKHGWVCPKCKVRYKSPGRHLASCAGPSVPAPVGVERKQRRRGEPVTIVHASLNGHREVLERFETAAAEFTTATKDVVAALAGSVHAIEIYKRERDDLAAWKDQIKSLLGPTPLLDPVPLSERL